MGGTLWSMLAGYAARMVPDGQRGRAILGRAGAGALPWVTSVVITAALATVVAAPRYRHEPGKGGHGRRTGCCTMSLTTRPESSGTSAP